MMGNVYDGKVSVNDQNYEFVLKNGKLFVLKNKNGNLSILNLDLINNIDKKAILESVIDNIIEASRKAIETKIQNGSYKNIEEIQTDLVECVSRINIPYLADSLDKKNIVDNKSVKEAIDDLTLSFLKQNQTLEEKKEIVKENIDVELKTLFQSHNITEYNINDSSSVVVYYKNNIPHTINNTNPNESIYDAILKQINLDQITSKEEIDKAIDNIMELDAEYKYSKNRNENIDNLGEKAINVKNSLSQAYGNIEMTGQAVEDPLTNRSLILADLNDVMKPVYIGNTNNNEVTIGKEKSIDNNKNIETSIKSENEQNLEETLEEENVKEKTKNILIKCYQEEPLTEEEIEFANFYREDAIFESLDVEVRLWMLQIHDYIDAMNNEYEINQQEKESNKVKKLEPLKTLNEEAREIKTFVTILSIIMGSIMILTIGILI